MSATFDAEREIEAARLIREQVVALAGDDPDFIRDSIEGETNLLEAVEAVTASILDDEALCAATAQRIGDLQARADRIKRRVELKRALIVTALDVAERKKLETSVATVTLKPVAPKVEVESEAEIPAEFWKAQAPKLDRKALLDALKQQRAVPGARLSNGSVTVSIRA